MKKEKWLKDSVARSNGFFSKTGSHLKSQRLSEQQINEWNGVPVEVEPAPVEVAPVVAEVPAPPKPGVKENINVLDQVSVQLTTPQDTEE